MSRRTANETARLVAAGYQAPRTRASCAKCARGTMYLTEVARTDYVRKDVYCTVHRTSVACGGWCPSHVVVLAVAA